MQNAFQPKLKSFEIKTEPEDELADSRENEPSPIEHGTVFDPEKELAEIRKNIPKNILNTEKFQILKERAEKYEQKLIYQKEGIARMRQNIINIVRKNQDIPLAELKQSADLYAEKYGFTAEQKTETHKVLKAYETKHKAVEKIRGIFQDDACRAYGYFFKEKPEGSLEIMYGPMTIHLRCHDNTDYAWAYSSLYAEGKRKNELTKDNINKALETEGANLEFAAEKDLWGCVIIERAQGKLYDGDVKQTHLHEESHAIDRLFELPLEEAEIKKEDLNNEKDVAGQKTRLREFLHALRREADQSLKTEIFSYFHDKTVPEKDAQEEILQLLTTEGGLYDYFENHRDAIIKKLVEKLGEKYHNLITEASEEAFDLSEGSHYYEYIKERIENFNALRLMGFTHEQTKGLLTYEPLVFWPAVVRRFQKIKKIRQEIEEKVEREEEQSGAESEAEGSSEAAEPSEGKEPEQKTSEQTEQQEKPEQKTKQQDENPPDEESVIKPESEISPEPKKSWGEKLKQGFKRGWFKVKNSVKKLWNKAKAWFKK